MCDKGNDAGLPSSLQLLDQLRTPGSPLRSQLCVAVSTISRRIAKEQQRALAQPEICSNISTAPVELYHRVLEAKQCLLHSLCVLPLWMPDITQNAPVAVLEILQPETQPDFESLHELAGSALRDVTITKATVIEPMPELASKVLKQQQTGGVESHQTQPGSYPHNSQHDAQNTQPQPPHADAFRSGKGVQEDAHQCGMHTDAHAQEEAEEVSADARMTMVFDDRDRAQNSDDHLKHVAEQCEAAREATGEVSDRCCCNAADSINAGEIPHCTCMDMPNMKSVACRIASRPSPHLTFPTPCVNKADIDALGVAANGAASTGPAMSTASACGDVDAAAERDLKSGGNGLARAGNGAGVPENVTVGTQARERKDYAADDVDADIGMADAPAMRPSIDITSDTLAAGNRATFEPGTPSDPEDFLMDEDWKAKLHPPANTSPAHRTSSRTLHTEKSTSPCGTQVAGDDAPRSPEDMKAMGSRSNSGRNGAAAAVAAAAGAAHASAPSSNCGSLQGRNTRAPSNTLKPSQVHGPQSTGGSRHTGAPGAVPGAAVNEMNSMIHAIELLNVVQSDTTWQDAEPKGGHLKGGPAALLTAIQSRGTEASMHKVQEKVLEDDPVDGARARKKRAPSMSTAPSGPQMHRTPSATHLNPRAPGAAQPSTSAEEDAAAQHRQFAYPGNTGATFVRVTGNRAPHGALHAKALTAEAATLCASAADTPVAMRARITAPLSHADGAAHALPDAPLPGTTTASVTVAGGVPHLPHSMHGGHAQTMHKHEGSAAADAPELDVGLNAPQSGMGSLWNAMGADTMHDSHALGAGSGAAAGGSVHIKMSPRGSNTGAMQVKDHQPSAPSASAAPTNPPVATTTNSGGSDGPDMLPGDLKAMRNRMNRADGGIGRKLTLEVLQTQFGKGLKDAAESLGMCATTLKRACRRLGVKRWPRTPEAAVQVLAEAEQTLLEMASRKNINAPFGAPWESWPTAQPTISVAPASTMHATHASADSTSQMHGHSLQDTGLLDVDKGAGFDEFDDFLDMLEVGE